MFDILLAEDNLVNQELAVKILEKYRYGRNRRKRITCSRRVQLKARIQHPRAGVRVAPPLE